MRLFFSFVPEGMLQELARDVCDMLIKDYPKTVDSSHVYCRAVNAVIDKAAQICRSCPLYIGEADSCQYRRNVKVVPRDAEPSQLPDLYGKAIEQGEETRFPQFFDIEGPGFPDYYFLIERAMQYAAEAHYGSFRKGTTLPYIIHPIEVAMIVWQVFEKPVEDRTLSNEQAEVVAAAVLHDVVEDTPHTVDDIRKEFNEHIAELVASESEDKSEHMRAEDSWKIRKQEFLDHLFHASKESKLIAFADKLANLRSLAKDYEKQGPALWQRFNQKDTKEHEWYYRSVWQEVSEWSGLSAYREYEDLMNRVFHHDH